MEQNSKKLSLEEVMKRAMESANRADIDEPPLKWPPPRSAEDERIVNAAAEELEAMIKDGSLIPEDQRKK